MISQPLSSLSNAVFLSGIALLGIVLYVGFAYLVTRSINRDVKRRWRYSILWGVSFGVVIFILFGIGFIWALFVDEEELGFMTLLKHPSSSLELFMGIVLFLVYPVLISLPFVFLVTFGTYWKQLGTGDLFINQLLYPVLKHPSDQSPDDTIDRVKAFIAKLLD